MQALEPRYFHYVTPDFYKRSEAVHRPVNRYDANNTGVCPVDDEDLRYTNGVYFPGGREYAIKTSRLPPSGIIW